MKRIISIDIVRGLVMVIMAIDHIRDLMHSGSLLHDPLDLSTTTPFLFFTRWITHLCAPIFVFLSGTSAYLSFKKKHDIKASRRFLLSRGIWLILLEFTIITFGVWWDIHFRMFLFQVIATIGFGFIFLSFLIKLNLKTLMAIGLFIVFGHDFIQWLINSNNFPLKDEIRPFFINSFFSLSKTRFLILAYPVIPWLGLMVIGFCCGRLFEKESAIRTKYEVQIGLGLLLLFVVLRISNFYGDPAPWTVQKNALFTFLSFMNVSKYPPSLLYSLVTLGIMFLFLRLAEDANNRFSKILMVYGKVPMFYYLLHWYLIHSIMFLILFAEGFHTSDLFPNPGSFGRPLKPNGLSLGGIYLVWISVIIILYPFCKRYGDYKSRHTEKRWLSYL